MIPLPRLPLAVPIYRLEDTATKAETLSELEARLEQTEGARLAAIDAQQRAEQQLAATQQTLSQLLEAIAQREQYEVLRRQYVTGEAAEQVQ